MIVMKTETDGGLLKMGDILGSPYEFEEVKINDTTSITEAFYNRAIPKIISDFCMQRIYEETVELCLQFEDRLKEIMI